MDYAALGERVRSFRQHLHLTQEQLAEKAEISVSFLGHIERGTRIASLETLLQLCAALTVTPNDLLGDMLTTDCTALPERVTVAPGELLQHIAMLLRREKA